MMDIVYVDLDDYHFQYLELESQSELSVKNV